MNASQNEHFPNPNIFMRDLHDSRGGQDQKSYFHQKLTSLKPYSDISRVSCTNWKRGCRITIFSSGYLSTDWLSSCSLGIKLISRSLYCISTWMRALVTSMHCAELRATPHIKWYCFLCIIFQKIWYQRSTSLRYRADTHTDIGASLVDRSVP